MKNQTITAMRNPPRRWRAYASASRRSRAAWSDGQRLYGASKARTSQRLHPANRPRAVAGRRNAKGRAGSKCPRSDHESPADRGKDGTILVVLQLAGGNDGLNTVIPYADDAYHRARPVLALPGNKILRLNAYTDLNPKLTGLKSFFDDGHLAVVLGVGYPNPNRSHFRSTEIWQTAADANQVESEG